MKTWQVIILTLFILVLVWFLPKFFIVAIVTASSIWGYVDARKIEIKKYKTGFATRPLHVLLGMYLLWIIYFPWYLSFRYKAKHGQISLKET